MEISGFTMVRNATLLDFPLEASIRSLLPVVSELVVNVGRSDDDTRERVVAIADPRIRIIDSTWDFSRGPQMLADETQRAMAACRHRWGIYIQADEVLADGSAEVLRQVIVARDADQRAEGVLVNYRHFYGGFDTVAVNRSWYRRETRAVRLGDSGVRSFRDAQGFRVGPESRRIRAAASTAVMHHYGWARPAWALAAKRSQDLAIYPWRREQDQSRPLLPWFPGIAAYTAPHPAVVAEWIAERRTAEQLVDPPRWQWHHLNFLLSAAIERTTGWRPFEYRNYVTV
ncbi:MAG: hypothetical protein V4503_13025 [Gemmatimonadota bacterium]